MNLILQDENQFIQLNKNLLECEKKHSAVVNEDTGHSQECFVSDIIHSNNENKEKHQL